MSNHAALVAGAGIPGLAAGIAISLAGRKPVLVEGASMLEPTDAGVSLDANALAALDAPGLGDEVRLRRAAGASATELAFEH